MMNSPKTYKDGNAIPSNAQPLVSGTGWGSTPGEGSDLTFSFVATNSEVFPGGKANYVTEVQGSKIGDFDTLTVYMLPYRNK